jgi:quercetin dioxygenase-like cupin family protein
MAICCPAGCVSPIPRPAKSEEFKPGDFIVEARGQWHKAENIGAEPIKLLVIDQVEPGEKTTVLRQPDATAGRN